MEGGHKGGRRIGGMGYYKYCKGIIIYGDLIQEKGLFAIRTNLHAFAFVSRCPAAFLGGPLTIYAKDGYLREPGRADHHPGRLNVKETGR